MISRLTVKVEATLANGIAVSKDITLDALDILGLLQQASPGIKPPTAGTGTLASPWEPKTPAEWFYCAKVAAIAQRQLLKLNALLAKESGTLKGVATTAFTGVGEARQAWLKVGGRRIRLLASNLYSSDFGLASLALDRGRAPAVVYKDASYPVLLGKLTSWATRLGAQDSHVTAALRAVLKGLVWNGPDALPLLATVLLVSEVARNHTAMHAALMMLDLLDVSARMNSPLAALPTGVLTWKKALWQDEEDVTCPDCEGDKTVEQACANCNRGRRDMGECSKCRGRGCRANMNCLRGRYCPTCRTCAASGLVEVRCRRCSDEGVATGIVRRSERDVPLGRTGNRARGGVQYLQAGLLPMSHTASAHGGAYSLEGGGHYYGAFKEGRAVSAFAPLNVLTIARRKEATIAATWLTLAFAKVAEEPVLKAQLLRAGITGLKLTGTPLTTDIDTTNASGKTVYDRLDSHAGLGFEDWVDKWVAVKRDLPLLPRRPARPAVRFAGARDEGDAPIPLPTLPYDKLDTARTELETYRTELTQEFASQVLEFALLRLFQTRLDSFTPMLNL